jgi:hypothetical protein
MGQQRIGAEQASGALRHIMLVIAVAVVMAAMMALTASPSFAGNCKDKGQVDANDGQIVNNKVGDRMNNACYFNGNCFDGDANN